MVRQLSGSCQAVFRQLSGSFQVVVRQLPQQLLCSMNVANSLSVFSVYMLKEVRKKQILNNLVVRQLPCSRQAGAVVREVRIKFEFI